MTVKEIINLGTKKLNSSNIEETRLISKILIAHILECKKEQLIIKDEEEVEEIAEKKFIESIDKIAKGYPLQYIVGKKEFMQMDFIVNDKVLIPRADTENLVEEVIKLSNGKKNILELCTGSGCIAISLAKYIKQVEKITATDISNAAIEVAKKNNEKLTKSKKIEFIQSDMFKNVKGSFDIIVSNPPYIKTSEIKEYSLKYEPQIALNRRRRRT